MIGIKSNACCIDLFKRLDILALPCEYLSSLKILISNKEYFKTNADAVLTQAFSSRTNC